MDDDIHTPSAPDATGSTIEPSSAASPSGESPEGAGLTRAGMVDPQRLLRIAGVVREVLEEARRIRPEAGAVDHLRRVHDMIYAELREALPPALYEELDDLTPDIKDGTLEELGLAHAEILGWLEGLFQGTQLALQLQAARAFGEMGARRRIGPGQQEDEEPQSDSRYL
jgi:Protein of unknown function (DUF2587)